MSRHYKLIPFDVAPIWNEIAGHISCQHHLYAFVRVNRTCFRNGVKDLWGEPRFMRKRAFDHCLSVIKQSRMDPSSTLFPYYEFPKLFRLKRIAAEIDGSELEELYENCRNVTEIMLRNSLNLTGERFVNIANMTPNVTVLHLGGNLHEDFKPQHMIDGLSAWKKLSNLEVDDPDESTSLMNYEWFSNEVMRRIFECSPGLEELILYNVTSLTDEGLEGLRSHGNKLKLMQLWRTGPIKNPTDAIRSIASCSRLVDLDISSDFLVNDMALVMLTDSLKNLRSIGFSVWDQLTDEGMVVLAKNLEKLEDIQIRGSVTITDRSLHALAEYRGSQLQDIVILHVQNVTDVGLKDILMRCTALKGLEVSQLQGITDDSFQTLVEHRASTIERLSVTRVNISVETVKEIIQQCTKLNLLEIRCSSILDSDSPLLELKSCGHKLEILTYEWRNSLKPEAWIALCEGCPNLYSLKLEGSNVACIPFESFKEIKNLQHMEQLEICVSSFTAVETGFSEWFKHVGPFLSECTSLTDVQLSVDSQDDVQEGEKIWRTLWEEKEKEASMLLSQPHIKFVEVDQFDDD